MLTDTLAFAGAALLLAMVPGPSLALVLRQTLRAGRRQALMTTLGNATGVAFWATAAVLGLSVLVATSHLAYDAIRACGAVMLVALGVRSLLRSRVGREPAAPEQPVAPEPSPQDPAPPGARAGRWSVFAGYRTGLFVSLANPKPAVFAMSVLPQFVAASRPSLGQFLLLVAVWVTVSSAWYVAVSWAISRVRAFLGRVGVRRWLERVSGAVLIGFGLRLAVEGR